ncbi:hypothetical protein HDU85_007612 [Gaertneriomyces sp. JEL0708]|nr:hypothetical protein HDU85_007612 [Gaertneriomyces sp. JEL0708]
MPEELSISSTNPTGKPQSIPCTTVAVECHPSLSPAPSPSSAPIALSAEPTRAEGLDAGDNLEEDADEHQEQLIQQQMMMMSLGSPTMGFYWPGATAAGGTVPVSEVYPSVPDQSSDAPNPEAEAEVDTARHSGKQRRPSSFLQPPSQAYFPGMVPPQHFYRHPLSPGPGSSYPDNSLNSPISTPSLPSPHLPQQAYYPSYPMAYMSYGGYYPPNTGTYPAPALTMQPHAVQYVPLCRYFQQSRCWAGSACRFSHYTGPGEFLSAYPTSRGGTEFGIVVNPSGNEALQAKQPQQARKHKQPHGRERSSRPPTGESSSSSGSTDERPPTSTKRASVDATTPRCKYFAKGTCWAGGDCRFRHE